MSCYTVFINISDTNIVQGGKSAILSWASLNVTPEYNNITHSILDLQPKPVQVSATTKKHNKLDFAGIS